MNRKISLSSVQSELSESGMSEVKGGGKVLPQCTCGCQYANQGGASTCDNSRANFNGHLQSPVPGANGCRENTIEAQQFWFDCD